jgi:hypothetical protein
MRSPIAALTWEIWQRGRRSVWLVMGIIALCSLINLSVPAKVHAAENAEAVYIFLMVCSFFLVFGIFHYAELNPRKNWHGFPYRLFALPVPTWVLVALPMLLGVVSVELGYLAWAKLVFAPMGTSIALWPAAVLGAGIICYQALIWSLAGFRITRIVVLGLAGIVFMNIAMLPFFPELNPWPLEKLLTVLTCLLAGLAMGAFLGGWFSVEKQRRGGGRGRGWFKARIGQIIDALPRRRMGFASPAAAQFWFEWRRGGLLLPVCTVSVLLLIFVPVSWLTRTDPEATLLTLAWTLGLPLILAVVIGKGFAKPDFWSGDISLAPFLAVRPLASGEMVLTKMKVAVLSVAIAWLPILVFLGLWLPLWANTTQLKELWEAFLVLRGPLVVGAILVLFLLTAMVLTWRGMVGSLWVGLSGNMRHWVGAALLHAVAVGFAVWGVVFWVNHFAWGKLEAYVSWLGWALALTAVLRLWIAAFCWQQISPGRVWRYILIWTGGTGSLVALGLLICPDIFWLKHLFILAALLPFPLARLGLAPRSLAKNRHR